MQQGGHGKHRLESARTTASDRLSRLEPPARLPGVDLARGLAIFGMFAAHMVITTPIEWSQPGTWSGIVDGRSAILFATLAGISLGLTAPRSAASAGPSAAADVQLRRKRLLVRAVVLWLFGILLTLTDVPVHVILQTYGVLFLIGAAMLTLRPRTLFAIAGVVAVVMPFVVGGIDNVWDGSGPDDPDNISLLVSWHYPFPLWTAFLAAGLGAGKLLRESLNHAWWMLGGGAVLAVTGYGLIGPLGDRSVDEAEVWWISQLSAEPHSSGLGESIGSGGFALAVIAGCVLLCTTRFRHIVWPIRIVGSMPLTAYTAHLVVWAGWVAGEGDIHTGVEAMDGFLALDPFWPMVLCVTGGCMLWALFIGKGPLEWALAKVSVLAVPVDRAVRRRVRQPA